MNVDDLTPKAQRRILSKILLKLEAELHDLQPQVLESLLYNLVDELDDLDDDDTFGTEGWKHAFDIDD